MPKFDDLPIVSDSMTQWARKIVLQELFDLVESGDYLQMVGETRVCHLHRALEQLCRRAVTRDLKDGDGRLLRAAAWILTGWIDDLGKRAGFDLRPRQIPSPPKST